MLRAEVGGCFRLCCELWSLSTPFFQVDLKSVRHIFKNQYGKHLDKVVSSETGGHYRDMLLALLNIH